MNSLQLRKARALLGLHRFQLAQRVKTVRTLDIRRLEEGDDAAEMTSKEAERLRIYLESVGIEFVEAEDGSAKLRDSA